MITSQLDTPVGTVETYFQPPGGHVPTGSRHRRRGSNRRRSRGDLRSSAIPKPALPELRQLTARADVS